MNIQEKEFIKSVVQSQQWPVFETLGRELIESIRKENVSMDTQWETAKDTVMREGKIAGIKMLLNEMFNIGSKNA